MIRPLRPALALAAMLPLGGCAAALVPVIAGGMIARQQTAGADDSERARRGADEAPTELTVGEQVAAPQRVAIFAPGTEPRSGTASNATVIAPPAPNVAAAEPAGNDPYSAFARFAIERAAPLPPGQTRRSALVDQASLTSSQPKLADCGDQPPAVVIDLDPGAAPFDLGDPPLPAPGIAARLAAIRSAGVTVLWSASLPASGAQKLYTILGASGLDPERTDRLLLLKPADDESKQLRRIAAARDWCILAIAGDRRSDFDEVFDFLRDPEGPIAAALEPQFGAGWFLAPPPID